MLLGVLTTSEFQSALRKLASQPLPPQTAFKLKRIIKLVNEETKNFDEIRNDIIDSYAVRDTNNTIQTLPGGAVQLNLDLKPEWSKKLEELYKLEIELPTISIKDLNDGVKLSAEELLILDSIVTE